MKESKQLSDQEKIIQDHRQMILVSGNLSDFQIENMQTWPFIIFDNVKEVKVDYTFSRKKEDDEFEFYAGEVKYTIKGVNKVNVDKMKDLEKWTKFLFWEETKVEVDFV